MLSPPEDSAGIEEHSYPAVTGKVVSGNEDVLCEIRFATREACPVARTAQARGLPGHS